MCRHDYIILTSYTKPQCLTHDGKDHEVNASMHTENSEAFKENYPLKQTSVTATRKV